MLVLSILTFSALSARAQSGLISTVVGPPLSGPGLSNTYLQSPTSVAVDNTGGVVTIYTASLYSCVVWKTQGGQTTLFAGVESTNSSCTSGPVSTSPTDTVLNYPVSVATCSGNIFIAAHGTDAYNVGGTTYTSGGLYEVTAAGMLSQLPVVSAAVGGGPYFPVAVACDSLGNVYLSSYFYANAGSAEELAYGEVDELAPRIGGGWVSTHIVGGFFDNAYTALAIDPQNNDLYGLLVPFALGWLGQPNLNGGSIQNLSTGNPGLSSNNTFDNPSGLAIDANSDYIVAEAVGTQGTSSVIELVQHNGTGAGTKTIIAGTGTLGQPVDGVPATQSPLGGVDQVAIDSAGDVYLADSGGNRVQEFHIAAPGPSQLTLATASVPQSAGQGFQQAGFNTSTGDFYYVSGPNNVNVVNNGASVVSPGFERVVASIPIGATGSSSYSTLTLVVDSEHNLTYVNNTADGNLYVVDGSLTSATSRTVVGSVALNNNTAYLLALDPGMNEIYVAGPTSSISAVRGGSSPTLIGNADVFPGPINSISVDTTSHLLYAVGNTGAGNGQEEAFITLTPDPASGVLTVATNVFPANESIPYPDFVANSIAADSLSGTLIASGAASPDAQDNQTIYGVYDILQVTPDLVAAQSYVHFAPIATSLDAANATAYVTDFDGAVSDPSSNAAAILGTGAELALNGTSAILASVTIPVFGTGATPPAPHVFDIEPDTSSYQAWISGSDGNDGGFVKLWDGQTQAITLAAALPGNGGGYLTVDSTHHAAFMLDQVNHLLWLINTPQWTPVPSPTLTQTQGGQSVLISAVNAGDTVFYTADGTPPGLASTACNTSSSNGIAGCSLTIPQGRFTVVNAIEVANIGSAESASNVAQQSFTAPAPTTTSVALSSASTKTSANDTATAIITPAMNVSTVTGTVTFTAAVGSAAPVGLCPAMRITGIASPFQVVCSFTVPATVGAYTVTAVYSGDAENQTSTGTAALQVAQGVTPPTLGSLSGASNVIAINQNNSPGLTYNAFLNADSSVGLIQDGAVLTAQSCLAFSQLSNSGTMVDSGVVYVDAANSRIYLAMLAGGQLYAAYESIDQQGNCTSGPLLQVASPGYSFIEMNVDPVQGTVYILDATGGGNLDSLYLLPAAPWSPASLPTAVLLTLDYSASYGPIVIDPSNHQVYINDLGGAPDQINSGFFVYDPTQSAIPASNIQHVVGYVTGSTAVPFNTASVLTNGAGKLVLINENLAPSSQSLTTPITILETTKFSFFLNTQTPNTYNSDVDITPGGGLSTIAATVAYTSISAADIDAVNGFVYLFGYNAPQTPPQPGSGVLLQYNLSAGATSPESVLASGLPLGDFYDSFGPWNRLNYNPSTTEILLSGFIDGSGALGVTSPVCAGLPLTLSQLAGSTATATQIGYPSVNNNSGYVYAVDSSAIVDVASPASGCTGGGRSTPTLIATTTTLTAPAAALSGTPATVTVGVTPASRSAGSLTATATVTDLYTPATTNTPQTTTFPGLAINAASTITLSGAGIHMLSASYPGDATHAASSTTTAALVSVTAVGTSGLQISEPITVTDTVVVKVIPPAVVSENEVILVSDVVSLQVIPPPVVNDSEVILVNDAVRISITPNPSLPRTPPPDIDDKAAKGGATITLSDKIDAASIYYTLDGSVPATIAGGSTMLYSAPFLITASTKVIAAIAVASGDAPSTTVTTEESAVLTASLTPQLNTLAISPAGSASETITLSSGASNSGASASNLPLSDFWKRHWQAQDNSSATGEQFTFTLTGLPKNATAQFNPATLSLSGASATTTLLIKTGVSSSATTASLDETWISRHRIAVLALLLFMAGPRFRKRRRALFLNIFFAGISLGLTTLTLSSCGASSTTNQTPPGAYTLTLTATSQQSNVTIVTTQTVSLVVEDAY